MARKIVITSGKGGVGKTTITTNLGVALANLNLKVLILDVDFGLNNLDVVMGVENRVVYDVVDVLKGRCRAKQALIQDFFNPTLYVLPSVHSVNNFNISSEQINFIISQIECMFDYILIDCPAGIEVGFHRAVKCVDEAIVVTTPHISAIRDADKVLSLLNSYNLNNIKILVNRVRGDLILNGEMFNEFTIKDYLNADLVGVVPEDDNVGLALNGGGAVNKNSLSFNAFEILAKNLHYGEHIFFDCTKRYKGFVGGLRKKMRKFV